MYKPHPQSRHGVIALWLLIALTWPPVTLAQEGELQTWSITSEALKGNLIGDPFIRFFEVYLPPTYKTSDRRYPVIYVLHGFGGDQRSLAGKVKSEMDRLIQQRQIKEMIAVFVDGSNKFGGSQYLSSPTIGDYETYIVSELVNRIDTLFRTIPHRNSRGITGFSMGGYGSMHLALKHPEVFSVVVPEAGTYDFDKDSVRLFTEIAGPLIAVSLGLFSKDQEWEEFAKWPLPVRNGMAYLAGVAPNPDKPPFYLDLPIEATGFPLEFRRVDEVWNRIVDNDIIHELDRYLNQPVRLKGIKIVHGTEDDVAFISQARSLDKAMTERGIAHVYEEHNGGHTFIAEKSLRFLSEQLSSGMAPLADVNNDGRVDILDVVAIGAQFGEIVTMSPQANPDVNRNGVVDIFDLVLVASHFGETVGVLTAPEKRFPSSLPTIRFENPRLSGKGMSLDLVLDTTVPLTGYDLRIPTEGLLKMTPDTTTRDVFRLDAAGTLIAAKLDMRNPWRGHVHLATLEFETDVNPVFSKAQGVSVDGQLIPIRVEPFAIDNLPPQRTRLLPNYPNPFNPETWLPFQLHKGAQVRITIYDAWGHEIRQFNLGYQPVGYYRTRERAVRWDGRNQAGERVASGAYFYRLEADDVVSIRRMVVLK